jgi:hypothetical protein
VVDLTVAALAVDGLLTVCVETLPATPTSTIASVSATQTISTFFNIQFSPQYRSAEKINYASKPMLTA